MGKPVEEAGHYLIEVVVHLVNPGSGEHNGLLLPANLDGVVGVEALDERPGAAHGHRVQHVEQVLGGEIVGVESHRIGEVVAQRADAGIGKRSIVAQEVAQQVIQVPQAVVHRGGGEHHQLLGRRAGQQLAQCVGPLGAGVAEIVGLVDHHHGVFVDVGSQLDGSFVLGVQTAVGHQLLVGHQLHRQHVLMDERPPRPVAQRGRGDHQHPLAAILHRLPDQLSGQEGLAQPDLIGNEDPVALSQDAPGPPQPIGLEGGEVDLRHPFGGSLRF